MRGVWLLAGVVAATLAGLAWAGRPGSLDESGAEPSDAALRRRLANERARAARLSGLGPEVRRLNRRRDAQRARRARARAGVSCCDAHSDTWRQDAYRLWLPPVPVTYADAYRECFRESEAASLLGDYSKPASRRCVLGKMHALKLAQWESCRRACASVSGVGVEVWDNGDGSTYVKGPGGSALARMGDDGRWVVESWDADGGELGRFDDEPKAIARAKRHARG